MSTHLFNGTFEKKKSEVAGKCLPNLRFCWMESILFKGAGGGGRDTFMCKIGVYT